jgi:hypothetical protein
MNDAYKKLKTITEPPVVLEPVTPRQRTNLLRALNPAKNHGDIARDCLNNQSRSENPNFDLCSHVVAQHSRCRLQAQIVAGQIPHADSCIDSMQI